MRLRKRASSDAGPPVVAGDAGTLDEQGLVSARGSLAYRPSSTDWRAYRLRRVLARATRLPGMRLAALAMAKLSARIERFHELETSLPPTIASVEGSSGGPPTKFGSGYGYDDERRELAAAVYHRSELDDKQTVHASESRAVYDEILRRVSGALKNRPEIRSVTNFGVGYGYVDSELARRFPEVRFYGLDRSRLTKAFNETFFRLPNLEFVAGDVFHHFSDIREAGPWLLLHARTLTILPRSFVRKLYASARSSGAVATVTLEQCGISWQTGRPYTFDEDPDQPSVALSAGTFIHNYPGLLNGAGFQVLDARLLTTKYSDRTLRIACMTAERLDRL